MVSYSLNFPRTGESNTRSGESKKSRVHDGLAGAVESARRQARGQDRKARRDVDARGSEPYQGPAMPGLVKYLFAALLFAAPAAHSADWLDKAWSDETIDKAGAPAITLGASAVLLVL